MSKDGAQDTMKSQTECSGFVATRTINWNTTPEHKQPRGNKPTRAMSAKERKRNENIEQIESHSTFITG